MEKYNRLCSNLEEQLQRDCENPTIKDTYCDLIHIFYEDCTKFRNQKMRAMMAERRKQINKTKDA